MIVPNLVERWIREHVEPLGALEVVHERAWATAARVPTADGYVWFKACAPVQTFEPRLTAALSARWPDRVTRVLAAGETRGWLLLADAGASVGTEPDAIDAWLEALPRYAELQRGEAAHVEEHLAGGVPDLRLATLPARYEKLLALDLPLEREGIDALRRFAPRFTSLCDELAAVGVPETIQHDDLHQQNLFARGGEVRVIDWGDASIGHPFATVVVTIRFLEDTLDLGDADPTIARLRDAYLEPWGRDHRDAFPAAMRVGAFARAVAYIRVRATLSPEVRAAFDTDFTVVLRRAVARTFR